MGIVIPLIIVVICCIIIWRASDGFATASDFIGRNLSEGVRGATINSIASSMPEVFTSLFFLFYLHDTDGFSGGIGTTAGSAIFNGMVIPAFVILVVVFSGAVRFIKVSQKVYLRDGISLILAEIIFIILISGEILNWWHGLILMGVYLIYLWYMLASMTRNGHQETINHTDFIKPEALQGTFLHGLLTFNFERVFIGKSKTMNNMIAWPLLVTTTISIAAVCLLLVQACEWLGSSSYEIPFLGSFKGLGIPIMFVAVILAAMASSIPDTIISMKDARKGNYDDAVSNALGSNIFDICFAMGFPLFIYTLLNGPIHMTPEIIDMSSELRMLLLILTILTILIYVWGEKLGKVKAFLLLGLYLVFTLYVVGVSVENEISVIIAQALRDIVSILQIR
ncbi:MAG: sodium:calcium antiporter [Candidatus Cyclobacteriaceae bacterium M3_2C_046]